MEALIARLEKLGLERKEDCHLTSAEIKEIERHMGGALPRDYRQFLEHFGYSYFDRKIAEVASEKNPEAVFPIGHFYGAAPHASLLWKARDAAGVLPQGWLPIAHGAFGGQITLALPSAKKRRGKVYYAGQAARLIPAERDLSPMLHFVSSSFKAFLASIAVSTWD